ncbi:hypothetical protein BSKO_11686 [Bryopsis sp. KO-2023]|nr:hypothetical protein BSKO_11686 [Bryopsis sp. KO-2023]
MEEIEELESKCRSLSARVGTYIRRGVAEQDALGADVKSLIHTIHKATEEVKQVKDEQERSRLMTYIRDAKGVLHGNGPGGDMRKLCHKKNPLLIQYMLGPRANVVTLRREQSLALKEEYHSFRDKAAWGVLIFPSLLMYFMGRAAQKLEGHEPYSLAPAVMAGEQIFLIWLCYMYVALALRENVLVVNGSNIRSWWITHHYLSIFACLIMLALPVDSPAVYMFSTKFLQWTAFQGLVMLFQNRYQRRRMYTRIALGKNSVMDVVTGESSAAQGQLMFLYPMLFVLQFWQMYIGAQVMVSTWKSLLLPGGWIDLETGGMDLRGQRGVFAAGLVFGLMGVLNFSHTTATGFAKLPKKFTMKNSGKGSGVADKKK